MTTKFRLLTATAVLAAMPAAPAFAQDQDTSSMEVITVTTQKREQSLADVPINITAYDTERLNMLSITQFDELSDFVPGLEIQEQSPNNPGFAIRGITSDDGSSAGEARVAVFQDGVSISRARSAYVELFDIERVEVAKGPQATLFGRGALIGGINIIQNKAELGEFNGSVRGGFGDFETRELGGHVNIPVGDIAAVRFAATHRSNEGYVENALGGDAMNAVDVTAYRAAARIEPNDRFTLDVIGNFQEDTPEGGTSFKSNAIAPIGGSLEPWEPAALNTFGNFEDGSPLGINRQVYGVTAIANYEINDAFTLNSISAWRRFEGTEIFDPDGTFLNFLAVAEDAAGYQWSEELRLSYDNGGRVSGFVGASWFNEAGRQRIPLMTDEAVAQAFLAPVVAGGAGMTVEQVEALLTQLGVPNADGFDNPFNPLRISVPALAANSVIVPLNPAYLEETTNFSETTAIDLFGDITFQATDRLELTAGLRWTREEKQSSVQAFNVGGPNNVTFGPTLFLPATPNGAKVTSDEYEFDDFTWRVAANYDVNDALNVWASAARGRRPDVIAFDSSAPDFFVTVPAEIVDSFETGLFWTGPNTTVQASVFYSLYENFQTSRFEPNNAVFITDNAGQATQYGLEAQVDHRFSENYALFATYAYNFAEFDDEDDQGNEQEFAGNTFRLSPEHAVSLGFLAEFDIMDLGTLSFVPTYTWQSEVFFDNDNDRFDAVQDEFQDSYGLLDLKVRFDAAGDESWWAEAYVENTLDEEYIIDAGNTGDAFGIPTFIAGAPRNYGMRFGTRF
ncbi:TonB-dependent receptor [Maricaulis sp. D1M11]|uniref:TonB-dependent receptor n=1 Tax=Maricaulis sp. D1M11 TaxID=3076117 RepID=UPI0039B4A694